MSEGNRIRAVIFAIIIILGLLAVAVPELTRPGPANILIEGPEQ